MHLSLFTAFWLTSHLIAPASSQNYHVVEVRSQTTLVTVHNRAPFANTSSNPAPTWNASAAFTFTPTNSSASSRAANSTSKGGLLGGILDPITSGLLGPITSGLLGPIASGGLNVSGIATGVSNVTNALSLSRPTISSLSMSLLSSVRWPNSSSSAAPTARANSTSKA